METEVIAKKIGGSIGVIIPKEVVKKESIHADDKLKLKVERADDLNWLWGRGNDIKTPTDKLMEEIDEGEEY